MTAANDDVASLGAALSARAGLREAAAGAALLAVLGAVRRSGWLAPLAEGVTVPELVALEGVPAGRVEAVLVVLAEAGIVRLDGDHAKLLPEFDALVAGASGVRLDGVLAGLDLEVRSLERATTAAGAVLDGPAALTLAEDWGVRATPGAQALYGSVFGEVPEFADALRSGDPFLDAGSGVGGALLSTALVFPELRAVGVERSPEVADELRRRVGELGLAGRVRVDAVDARELDAVQEFGTAYWAQEFFAVADRTPTLSTIARALRPGGLLLLQELSPPGPRTLRRAVDELVGSVIGASFGRTAEELVAEGVAAGFEHVRTVGTAAGRLVLLRSPATG